MSRPSHEINEPLSIEAECEVAREVAREEMVRDLKASIIYWVAAASSAAYPSTEANALERARLRRLMLAAVESDLPTGRSS